MSKHLPLHMLLLLGISLMLIGGMGSNTMLAFLATIVLLAILRMLWRPGETPIILVIFLLQWLQASIKVFYANWAGIPLEELSYFGGNIVDATVLSLLALLFVTFGVRLGQGAHEEQIVSISKVTAESIPTKYFFQWYFVALVVSFASIQLTRFIPGLAQPLLVLGYLKWAFFFILGYAVLVGNGKGKSLFVGIVIFEFLLGIGGFFSEFRTVFLFSAMAIVSSNIKINRGKLVFLIFIGVALIYLSIIWTAIKGDYRNYVSGGVAAQIVTVDYGEGIKKLYSLASEVDDVTFTIATKRFIDRLSYVDFFAAVKDNVPAIIAHTNGDIWWDAIIRPFTPRMFFSGKTAIDDSERTSRYSGVYVAGADQGTSISIGYIGETYIDFGAMGMMLPLLLFGYLLGRTYRWIVVTGPLRGLLGMGVASSVFIIFSLLESSVTKTFGRFVAAILVVWLFGRFIAPHCLPDLVSKPLKDSGISGAFKAHR